MAPETIADPETDPTATYAVDPALVRRLAERVVCAARPATLLTHTPLTGAPLASLPLSTPDDVGSPTRAPVPRTVAGRGCRSSTASGSCCASTTWCSTGRTQLLDLIQLESGKARKHAFEEVADVAIVSPALRPAGPPATAPATAAGAFPLLTRVDELRHPKGVVGIVSPWNYPLSLSHLRRDAGAAGRQRRGPAPRHPVGADRAVGRRPARGGRAARAGAAGGRGRSGASGRPSSTSADYVSFTGSTATGRTVAERAGARLVGASLELGGKNADARRRRRGPRPGGRGRRPCLLLLGRPALHLGRAAATSHEDVADEFVAAFVRVHRRSRLGAGLDFTPTWARWSGPASSRRSPAHVEDAREQGRARC